LSNVKVIDSIMGSGKTSYAIQMMQEAPAEQKFIYVTPFLDEVKRIKQYVTHRDFKEPTVEHGGGTKLNSLKRLIADDEDIATTHALFGLADQELMDLLLWGNYILIVDECMDILNVLPSIKKDDISLLINSNAIKIQEDRKVVWIAPTTYDTKYNDVKHYALAGNLFNVLGIALYWNFPPKIFNMFEEVFIMTYLFDGQLQKYYYDLHNVKYDYYTVINEAGHYKLYPKSGTEDRTHLKELIKIYDGRLNNIGDNYYTLSKSWFDIRINRQNHIVLKNNLYNYFRNIKNASADEILWTTFKDSKNKITGRGFTREESKSNEDTKGNACFTSFNLRATNKYSHKTVLAFCLNRFMHPIEEHFFNEHGVMVDEELLALSDLLQWLFRSAVRKGESVDIYIPSRRMRDLLIRWLNNEI